MTVRDYTKLRATETDFETGHFSERARELVAGLRPSLATSLRAIRDAPKLPGRFPVVVYAPSFSSVSWENADLCEYIASHGYVVLSSPSFGTTSRCMTLDIEGINAQVGDIGYLIAHAHTLSNADAATIAVAGFSWGGLANLVAAARDQRINALIALDGSLRYFPGLVRQAGDVRAERMTIPLLYFAQREHSLELLDRFSRIPGRQGPSVLNSWTQGDLIYAHMLGMSHEEFGSMFQRDEEMWTRLFRDYPLMKGDYGREDGMVGYAWMARYVIHFLDAFLKDIHVAKSFLRRTPTENGAPAHVMAVQYRQAEVEKMSLEWIRQETGLIGFDRLGEWYESLLKRRPKLKLDELVIDAWAEELLDEGHLQQSVAVLELNVRMYPDSSNAHERLARGYEKQEQIEHAVSFYNRALEMDPLNEELRGKISEICGRRREDR